MDVLESQVLVPHNNSVHVVLTRVHLASVLLLVVIKAMSNEQRLEGHGLLLVEAFTRHNAQDN